MSTISKRYTLVWQLKDSYYKQAILNLKEADKRFAAKNKQLSLI
jgi:hypothetical protein